MLHQPPDWVNDYVAHLEWESRGRQWPKVDCWGLIYLAFRQYRNGTELPRLDHVAWEIGDHKTPDHGAAKRRAILKVLAAERAVWTPVTTKPIRLGAELAFDVMVVEHSGVPVHAGLIVAPGWLLHIQEGHHAVCERYPSLRLPLSRIDGIYRHAA